MVRAAGPRPRRPQHRLLALALAVAMLAAACASGAAGAPVVDRAACDVDPTPSAPAHPSAVPVLHVPLVDDSRATPATEDRPERPCRVLPTEIWLPAAR